MLNAFYQGKNVKIDPSKIGEGFVDIFNVEYDSKTVFKQAKEISKDRKCKESFEVIVKLNVDPTKGDQNVRGTCVLPAGTGKQVKICVFAGEEFAKQI